MVPELRRATPEDAGAAWALTMAGFETYRSFAPAGWDPPQETAETTRARLAREGAHGVVAVADGAVVGFGAFEPAREGVVRGRRIPGLAHVWAIFAAESHWGTGLATALLAGVTEAMRHDGFPEARLSTPSGQRRARRFYAREGWIEQGPPFDVPELGLELVELRRRL
jgi:GNAT superfamily N-acetyltransferase